MKKLISLFIGVFSLILGIIISNYNAIAIAEFLDMNKSHALLLIIFLSPIAGIAAFFVIYYAMIIVCYTILMPIRIIGKLIKLLTKKAAKKESSEDNVQTC